MRDRFDRYVYAWMVDEIIIMIIISIDILTYKKFMYNKVYILRFSNESESRKKTTQKHTKPEKENRETYLSFFSLLIITLFFILNSDSCGHKLNETYQTK